MTEPKNDPSFLLQCTAYAAYRMSLGNRNVANFEWFNNVHPGNLVMEISSMFMRSMDQYRLGTLKAIVRDNYHSDEQWKEIEQEWEGEPRPQDTFYDLLLLDGGKFRWSNCKFIRVPISPTEPG